MVKLVDIPDLGSGAARHGGSSPSTRTKISIKIEHGKWNSVAQRMFHVQLSIFNIQLMATFTRENIGAQEEAYVCMFPSYDYTKDAADDAKRKERKKMIERLNGTQAFSDSFEGTCL